jgi:hypothetical protein
MGISRMKYKPVKESTKISYDSTVASGVLLEDEDYTFWATTNCHIKVCDAPSEGVDTDDMLIPATTLVEASTEGKTLILVTRDTVDGDFYAVKRS